MDNLATRIRKAYMRQISSMEDTFKRFVASAVRRARVGYAPYPKHMVLWHDEEKWKVMEELERALRVWIKLRPSNVYGPDEIVGDVPAVLLPMFRIQFDSDQTYLWVGYGEDLVRFPLGYLGTPRTTAEAVRALERFRGV